MKPFMPDKIFDNLEFKDLEDEEIDKSIELLVGNTLVAWEPCFYSVSTKDYEKRKTAPRYLTKSIKNLYFPGIPIVDSLFLYFEDADKNIKVLKVEKVIDAVDEREEGMFNISFAKTNWKRETE